MTQWTELKALFKHAHELHGRIDHVFSNAGISSRANYLTEQLDDSGELMEPSQQTFDINLRGMINTSYLGFHYMRHQTPAGGSVVVTASASSFQRFRVTDYATAKHGVLGFMRGMVPNLQASGLPIRINGISPGWTATGIIPEALLQAVGAKWQTPEAVARSVALLMADESRQGQLVYSVEGRYMEIEEGKLLKVAAEFVGEPSDDMVTAEIQKKAAELGRGGKEYGGSS